MTKHHLKTIWLIIIFLLRDFAKFPREQKKNISPIDDMRLRIFYLRTRPITRFRNLGSIATLIKQDNKLMQ